METKVMLFILGLCLIIDVSGICEKGFVFQSEECVDINECVDGSNKCNLSQTCENTPGSYKCVCLEGFSQGFGELTCEGSYYCRCDLGYVSNKTSEFAIVTDDLHCQDIDECRDGGHACGNLTCENTPGSYKCVCRDGFRQGSGESPCEDVNECESRDPVCGLKATCVNTIGSYYCRCNPGYVSHIKKLFITDNFYCQDIDECRDGSHACGSRQICENTPGSYKCVCRDGFRQGYGECGMVCEDVNECVAIPPVCGTLGTCTNTLGSYTCTCPEGFGNPNNNSSRAPCEEWGNVLQHKCKDADSVCKLNTLRDLTRNLTGSSRVSPPGSSRVSPPVLFRTLDALLEAPPVGHEDAVLQLTEALVQNVETSTVTTQHREHIANNNTEVDIMHVGPNTSLTGSVQLKTVDALLEIDLPVIARNNDGSASVVLLTSNSMHNVFNNSHFRKRNAKRTYMGAKVVLIILPQVTVKTLPKPIMLTFQHFNVSDPADKPACVYWSEGAWVTDGCSASESMSNSTHTVCSCTHLSTFAMIMQTNPNTESDPVVEALSAVFVLIGLVFLTLALLTFALCRRNSRVTNVARLNLSVCLLLAHALFLLTQTALRLIQPHRVLCKLLAGVLHFLFLCCFVWMSAEAVLLFLSVRKLRQIKAKDRTGPHWRYKLLIGYGIPLVIVAVAAIAVPDGHGSEKCWLVTEKGFNWSFLGPVCLILTGNIILFIIIFITIHTTLRAARSEASKVKYTRLLLFKIMAQCVILGCPWIFLMASEESRVLELIFVFLTSQQGTVIFLIHCLLNDEVRKQYAKWWKKYGLSSKFPDTSASLALSTTRHSSNSQTGDTTLHTAQQTEAEPDKED
ncbi:adhesion G protein-coupled receptor E1-like isoform X2 [Sardina pilchardus]|uniref:adhesion G protein-coupled receptor E1-like isoform X2 n=1 Tax=Sardina pilchardus TaxID=27697 RepID=UPI002E15AA5B